MPDLYIDIHELNELTNMMASKLTAQNFDKLMKRTMTEVGRRAKTPIKEAVVQQYEVKKSWVGQAIKEPKVGGAGTDVFCKIPLAGKKGTIGGTFHAKGGAHGWNVRSGKKYKISTKIVKGQTGKLPDAMSHQGGQPPFRNLSSSKIGKIAFTRKGKDRLPIASVSGLAMPQMPMNRAKPRTERKILELAMDRTMHNFEHLFG